MIIMCSINLYAQDMRLSANIYVQKQDLLEVLEIDDRSAHVKGLTRLVSEATGREPSRYSVTGTKNVEGVRMVTLVFPKEIVRVVLGK